MAYGVENQSVKARVVMLICYIFLVCSIHGLMIIVLDE